jgi:hypothetical protein
MSNNLNEKKPSENLNDTEKKEINFSQINKNKKKDETGKMIGLRNKVKNNEVKKELKNNQKEMMNLIENSNFDESETLDKISNRIKFGNNFNEEGISVFYDNDCISVIDINAPFMPDLSGYINNSEFANGIDEIEGIDDYNPNESDLYIDTKNKNFMLDPLLRQNKI